MHKTPKLAQLGTPRRTQARLGTRTRPYRGSPQRRVDQCRGRDPGRVVGLHGRVAARRLPCCSAHARAPARRAASTMPRAPARLVVPCRSAQWPYLNLAPRAHLAMSWPGLRYRACLSSSQSRYTIVYRDILPPAARLLMSQYNSCNVTPAQPA